MLVFDYTSCSHLLLLSAFVGGVGTGERYIHHFPLCCTSDRCCWLAIFSLHLAGSLRYLELLILLQLSINAYCWISAYDLPLFVELFLLLHITSFIITCLGWAITMLLTDRNFNTLFLILRWWWSYSFQHLFWFFGHPEVHIRYYLDLVS